MALPARRLQATILSFNYLPRWRNWRRPSGEQGSNGLVEGIVAVLHGSPRMPFFSKRGSKKSGVLESARDEIYYSATKSCSPAHIRLWSFRASCTIYCLEDKFSTQL